jgi:HSP20 family molecular chaperone IbpA
MGRKKTGIRKNDAKTKETGLRCPHCGRPYIPSDGAAPERLVDVIDKGNNITVLAELPGTLREQLTIRASESELIIESSSEGKKYRKIIALPKVVDPDTASAQLNNGVLEVIFNKAYLS